MIVCVKKTSVNLDYKIFFSYLIPAFKEIASKVCNKLPRF